MIRQEETMNVKEALMCKAHWRRIPALTMVQQSLQHTSHLLCEDAQCNCPNCQRFNAAEETYSKEAQSHLKKEEIRQYFREYLIFF